MGVAGYGGLFATAAALAGAARAAFLLGRARRTGRSVSDLRLAIASLRRDLAEAAPRFEPWWAVLRLPREATRAEIRHAYQALSRASLLRARRDGSDPDTARLRAALAQALAGTVEA